MFVCQLSVVVVLLCCCAAPNYHCCKRLTRLRKADKHFDVAKCCTNNPWKLHATSCSAACMCPMCMCLSGNTNENKYCYLKEGVCDCHLFDFHLCFADRNKFLFFRNRNQFEYILLLFRSMSEAIIHHELQKTFGNLSPNLQCVLTITTDSYSPFIKRLQYKLQNYNNFQVYGTLQCYRRLRKIYNNRCSLVFTKKYIKVLHK